MKKLFTLLCATLFGVAAFAQDAYDPAEHTAVVSGTDNLCTGGWASADAMTYDATDGLWKVTLTAKDTKVIEFKVVYDGEWYGDNGNNYQFMVSEPSDVLITFDPVNYVATYSGPKVIAYDPNKIDFVVAAGSDALLNGISWDVTAEVNKLTQVDDGYYQLELKEIAAGSYNFKFAANGSWAKQWGAVEGTETLENGKAVPAQGGSNPPNFTLVLPKGYTYDVTLTLDNMDPENPMVTASWVEAGTAVITDDVYSIAGTMNGWNEKDESTEMTKIADGVFAYTFSALEAGDFEFKVVKDHGWAEAWGGAAAGQETDNATFTLTEPSNVTITFDANEKSISIAIASADAASVYAIGYDGTWNPAAPFAFTAKGGNVFVATLDITSGYIGISTTKGATDSDWSGFNAGRIAVSPDFVPENGVAYAYEIGVDASFHVTGVYTITVDLNAATITFVQGADAIQSLDAAKKSGVIYNLAGQRVEKVTRGLYIMNGKKYIVK